MTRLWPWYQSTAWQQIISWNWKFLIFVLYYNWTVYWSADGMLNRSVGSIFAMWSMHTTCQQMWFLRTMNSTEKRSISYLVHAHTLTVNKCFCVDLFIWNSAKLLWAAQIVCPHNVFKQLHDKTVCIQYKNGITHSAVMRWSSLYKNKLIHTTIRFK